MSTYYNIVLGENKQNLQRVPQYLRPLLHNFIFITDWKNTRDDLLSTKQMLRCNFNKRFSHNGQRKDGSDLSKIKTICV